MLKTLITLAVIICAVWLAVIAVRIGIAIISFCIDVIESVKCNRRFAKLKKKQEDGAHDNRKTQ